MILLNRKNNILSWCDEIKSNYLLKRSKKKKMKLYKNSVTKSGRRNVIGRASRTGISGLEVVTSQRKEEVVPEVRNQRKKLLEWSFKQKLPLSLLQLLSTFKILSNRFYSRLLSSLLKAQLSMYMRQLLCEFTYHYSFIQNKENIIIFLN